MNFHKFRKYYIAALAAAILIVFYLTKEDYASCIRKAATESKTPLGMHLWQMECDKLHNPPPPPPPPRDLFKEFGIVPIKPDTETK